MRSCISLLLLCTTLVGAAACDSGGNSTTNAGSTGSGGSGGSGGSAPVAGCTEPTAIACVDTIIQEMNLKSDVAPGLIMNEPEPVGFVSIIDATAGGFGAADPDSYVYGRFTDTGLEKVEISDDDALDSMDWDIAFRRYIIRINSDDSGPSCVTAARTIPGSTTYEALAAVPDKLTFNKDDYFTESCELIPDGSTLEGSPATALSSYWSYPGCIAMTGNVFVLELKDGRHLKLIVDAYYKDLDSQKKCNEDPNSFMMSAGATMRVRWAFLP
jgi:hypothetical protein